MTYNYYSHLLKSAAEIKSEKQFIEQMGFQEQIQLDADNFIKAMHIIYLTANGTFEELLKEYKIIQISKKYEVPYKTIQHWIGGDRTAPEYVKKLIAFAIICDLEE